LLQHLGAFPQTAPNLAIFFDRPLQANAHLRMPAVHYRALECAYVPASSRALPFL
jgi:hypothetical protein